MLTIHISKKKTLYLEYIKNPYNSIIDISYPNLVNPFKRDTFGKKAHENVFHIICHMRCKLKPK